ncbi:hypothetical protein, partial [Actinosynnema sp.]|uniref:hypothetical protein n=1 Tax=Actinosynnema sp. TaxID=1872144 RepID=UPI003F86CA20
PSPDEISEQSLTDARLLLDKDGHDLHEALRVIDWATQDSFWKANVTSITKLRKHYDTLRLKAEEDQDPRWRHLRSVESIPDDEIDPDDVLGPDTWSCPAPPREIDEGPTAARREWYRRAAEDHRQDRLREARAVISRQQNRDTA